METKGAGITLDKDRRVLKEKIDKLGIELNHVTTQLNGDIERFNVNEIRKRCYKLSEISNEITKMVKKIQDYKAS